MLSALTMMTGVCTADRRLLGLLPYTDLCSGKCSLDLQSGNHCKWQLYRDTMFTFSFKATLWYCSESSSAFNIFLPYPLSFRIVLSLCFYWHNWVWSFKIPSHKIKCSSTVNEISMTGILYSLLLEKSLAYCGHYWNRLLITSYSPV